MRFFKFYEKLTFRNFGIFPDFLCKATVTCMLKIDLKDFFFREILLRKFSGVQNEVLHFLSKVNTWNFSDFLHEVTAE